ncbi:MAG: 30S ribosomal protein S8 [Spirochaetia bacterium]|nr:30S ribosomal protein S8 [Spirochaetia bacterium]
MSVSDTIADSLTRIRNAQNAGHEKVSIPASNVLESIVKILKNEGFIAGFNKIKLDNKNMINIELKYYEGRPVITQINRISKPGRRVYTSWKNIRPMMNNIGINILSTPKGVITGKEAKMQNVGGEHLCEVW